MTLGLIAALREAAVSPNVEAHLGLRARLEAVIEVELAAMAAAEALGHARPGTTADARAALPPIPDGLEAETLKAGREVKPVVDWLRCSLPEDAAQVLHAGLTTQDVVDTANALRWRRALQALDGALTALIAAAADYAEVHARVPMVGHTNGLPAAPLTCGYRIARHVDGWLRDQERLARATRDIAVAQLGGAVGLARPFGAGSEAVWNTLAQQLHLDRPPISWHVTRDRPIALAQALCAVAQSLGRLGQEVMEMVSRGEMTEGRHGDGIGASSAMAHKRNPRLAEQLTAFAVQASALGTEAKAASIQRWDRSAAELMVETDAIDTLMATASAAVETARALIPRLHVHDDTAARNLDGSARLVFTEAATEALAARVGWMTARKVVADAVKSSAATADFFEALDQACARSNISSCPTAESLLQAIVARADAEVATVVGLARKQRP